MDALNKETIQAGNLSAAAERFRVAFGGTYRESWQDGRLSVYYENRRYVEAELREGLWHAVGGDEWIMGRLGAPFCPPLERLYFEAAATAQWALEDCRRRGLPYTRMADFFYAPSNALVAPELMRILMDECGVSLSLSYQIVAHCCGELHAAELDAQQLYHLQPRTAHVVSILRSCSQNSLAVYYDGRDRLCRSELGAVQESCLIRLGFKLLGGTVKRASLVLLGDAFRREYEMKREGESYSVSLLAPDEPAALWYFFRIETAESFHYLCPDESGYHGVLLGHEAPGFRLTVYRRGFETPEWFRRSVMYQVFPDRFGFSDDDTAQRGIDYHKALGQSPELHGSLDEPVRHQPRSFERDYSPDDFYGGTLKGIRAKLPYLKELGISCLYLNPIVEARSNHRYDASDYMKVDPILGTNADFEELCAAARAQGIRIMLDGVFSHTGADSVYFNRGARYDSLGACQGEQSEFYPWYDFSRFPDEYRCWWGFKDLPEVNENNPKWQEFVISGDSSVVKTWLRRGASAWRLDVADELPDGVLSLIREASKAEDAQSVILGEVWEDAVIKESYGGRRNYALGYSLDSVMNYPLRTALLDFSHKRISAYGLRDFLISQQMNYPKPMYYALMNLLGSHDVDRIRTALATSTVLRGLSRAEQLKLHIPEADLEHAVALEKLCAAVQFAIPGVPSIYYGDEQGMQGVCDPFNRLPFKEGSRELHDYYAALAKLRNSADALQRGEAEFFAASADVLLVLRYISGGADAFGKPAENGAYLAVVNRGDEAARYTIDVSAAGLGIFSGEIGACSAEIICLQ